MTRRPKHAWVFYYSDNRNDHTCNAAEARKLIDVQARLARPALRIREMAVRGNKLIPITMSDRYIPDALVTV